MGTAAEKERRKNWTDLETQIIEGAANGEWWDDPSLKQWLAERGRNPDGPAFMRYYSKGPKAVYGPSYDFGKQHDFQAGEEIPWQTDPSQTWYDPSVPENWQKTDKLKGDRMSGFFKWAMDTPEGQAFVRKMGGNAIAANYRGRALSQRPNAQDLSWFYEGGLEGTPGFGMGPGGPPTTPPPASPYPDQPTATANAQSIQALTNQLSGMGGSQVLLGAAGAARPGGVPGTGTTPRSTPTSPPPSEVTTTTKKKFGTPWGPKPAQMVQDRRPSPPKPRTSGLYSGFGV